MTTTRLISFLGLLLAAGLGSVTQSYATTAGITLNSGSSYAFWDALPGAPPPGGANVTISPAATASAGVTSPSLQVTTAGFSTGAGDRLYLGGAPSTWAVGGTAATPVNSFSLELKNYQFSSQSLLNFFTVSLTLGGVPYAPDSATARTLTEVNGGNTITDEIVTYTWSNSIAANTAQAFNLNFNSTASNISIDGFAINTAAVPEPSTLAGAALGGLAVFGARRRRRQTPA